MARPAAQGEPDGVGRLRNAGQKPVLLGRRISARNSSRVGWRSRNAPSMQDVTATEFCFSTPRIIMQKCTASITTPTPRGWIASWIVSAIWTVSRSCTWSRRANMSTRRGTFDRPEHLAVRDVGDVGLAVERQQVVLAEREHVDVLDDHHLVVVDREERLADERLRGPRRSPWSGSGAPSPPARASARAPPARGPRRRRTAGSGPLPAWGSWGSSGLLRRIAALSGAVVQSGPGLTAPSRIMPRIAASQGRPGGMRRLEPAAAAHAHPAGAGAPGGDAALLSVLKGLEIQKTLGSEPVLAALRHFPAAARPSSRTSRTALHPKLREALAGRGYAGLYTPPARGLRARPGGAGRRRRHAHGLGQDALLQPAGPRPHPEGPGRARALPVPDQGAGAGPAGRAARADRGARGRHRHLHLRRRHAAGRAQGDPRARARRGHEPRHAPQGDPAAPHQVGEALREPALRRDRRAAQPPRRLRLARRQRPAAAAAALRVLRLAAAVRLLVGHDRQPEGARGGR